MKAIVLFVASLFVVPAFAGTYKCSEKAMTAWSENRLQYSVFVTELRKITDPKIVKDNDGAQYVRVSILSRDPNDTKKATLDRPSFVAVATNSDVMFHINAWKQHGFTFNMYMDELDQTSMDLKDVKKDISLNCHYSE